MKSLVGLLATEAIRSTSCLSIPPRSRRVGVDLLRAGTRSAVELAAAVLIAEVRHDEAGQLAAGAKGKSRPRAEFALSARPTRTAVACVDEEVWHRLRATRRPGRRRRRRCSRPGRFVGVIWRAARLRQVVPRLSKTPPSVSTTRSARVVPSLAWSSSCGRAPAGAADSRLRRRRPRRSRSRSWTIPGVSPTFRGSQNEKPYRSGSHRRSTRCPRRPGAARVGGDRRRAQRGASLRGHRSRCRSAEAAVELAAAGERIDTAGQVRRRFGSSPITRQRQRRTPEVAVVAAAGGPAGRGGRGAPFRAAGRGGAV